MPKAIDQSIDAASLKIACYALHQAIVDLPRGVVKERLLVSVLEALRHLHAKRFVLMERTVFAMAELVGTSADHKKLLVSLHTLQAQLAVFLKEPRVRG